MLLVRQRAPWYFRCVRHAIDQDWRGSHFAWSLIERAHRHFGILDQCAPLAIDDTETVLMPLYWPSLVRKNRLPDYERHQIAAFAEAIDRLGSGVTLLDCGADVGLFTRLLLRRTHRIASVIAIEPNPRSHFILSCNLRGLHVPAKAILGAVSDLDGWATLHAADYNEGDHARFITPGTGDTRVVHLDGLGLPRDCPIALKIDVEGEELNVIRGARETLTTVPAFAVQIEANVDVVRRTSVDPGMIVKAIQEVRPVSLTVIHDHRGVVGTSLDTSRPFFSQYPGLQSCDIIMSTA